MSTASALNFRHQVSQNQSVGGQGASMTSQVNMTLGNSGKDQASRQRWFAPLTLPTHGYFIMFLSFVEASFA